MTAPFRGLAFDAILLVQERDFPEIVGAARHLRTQVDRDDPEVTLSTIADAFDNFSATRHRFLPDDDPYAALDAYYENLWCQTYFVSRGRGLESRKPAEIRRVLAWYSDQAMTLGRNTNRNPAWYGHALTCAAGMALWIDDYTYAEALEREAMEVFTSVPERERSVTCPVRLGSILVWQKRFEEAEPLIVDAYQRALASVGPADVWSSEVWVELVHLYAAWGKPELASPLIHAHLDALLNAGALDPCTLVSNAWLAMFAGLDPTDYELLLETAQRAVAADPNPLALTALGIAYYRVGQFADARDVLTRAGQLRRSQNLPIDSNGLTFLAMAEHKLGRTADAQELMAQVREIALTEGLPDCAREAERTLSGE